MRPRGGIAVFLAALFVLGACTGQPESTPGPSASAAAPSEPAEPSFSAVPTRTAVPTSVASAGPTESPLAGTEYTVRAGDSLAGIARAHGTSTAQLQAWNAERHPSLATNPNVIEPGWVLIVSADPGVTPLPAPTATPQPMPPPSGSGCTAGNRVAAGSAEVFRTIPNAGAGVALTFDMGGRMDPAVDIMNFLVASRVCATIFATGIMSETAQGQQVLAIIRAHPELFEIGNHTMDHCDLVRGGGGSPSTGPCTGSFDADRIRQEMTDAEAILRAGTGQSPQPYWRPPYGSRTRSPLTVTLRRTWRRTPLSGCGRSGPACATRTHMPTCARS